MSEILFRAKRADNGEWVCGDLLRETDVTDNTVTRIYEAKGRGTFIKYEVNHDTVCQYTGVRDNYGKKIFVGDIINEDFGNCVGVVMFGEHELEYGFYVEWKSKKAMLYRDELLYWINEAKAKVIGNIFDNTEILKESEGK